MSLVETRSVTGQISRAERALQFPVGAASPLWLMFAGAASAGMAYWWLTRWARPANLEALLGVGKAAATAVVEATAPVAEAVVAATEVAEESIEAVVGETAEVERLAEALPPAFEAAAPVPAPVAVQEVAEPVAEAPPEIVRALQAELEATAKPKTPRRLRPAAKPSLDS